MAPPPMMATRMKTCVQSVEAAIVSRRPVVNESPCAGASGGGMVIYALFRRLPPS